MPGQSPQKFDRFKILNLFNRHTSTYDTKIVPYCMKYALTFHLPLTPMTYLSPTFIPFHISKRSLSHGDPFGIFLLSKRSCQPGSLKERRKQGVFTHSLPG